MNEIIISPQMNDMSSGMGKYEFSELTLKEALNWFEDNLNDWGTISIYYNDYSILRKFDYDLYSSKNFYYNLSWELSKKCQEITFTYCFMNKDISIILV